MNKNRRQHLIESRKKKELSQEEIAKIIGVKRATYASYETGHRTPSIETAEILGKILGEKNLTKLLRKGE